MKLCSLFRRKQVRPVFFIGDDIWHIARNNKATRAMILDVVHDGYIIKVPGYPDTFYSSQEAAHWLKERSDGIKLPESEKKSD